jgi:hypothetical protein
VLQHTAPLRGTENDNPPKSDGGRWNVRDQRIAPQRDFGQSNPRMANVKIMHIFQYDNRDFGLSGGNF